MIIMKNNNKYKKFLNINLILGFTSLIIAIINAIFIKNNSIAGIIIGANLMMILYDLIICMEENNDRTKTN